MTAAVLAIITVTVFVTSFISGILGMAGGMILMGVFLALMPVPAAMMLHGVAQLASNGWRAWLWRREIDWRIFRGNLYGSLLILVVFCVLQLVAGRATVYIVLGLTPFVSYVLPPKLKLNVDKPYQPFACGVVATGLQLLSGVAGPILDVFFLQSKMSRHRVVATKASTQTLAHLLKILYFGFLLGHDQGRVEWWLAISMIVVAMAGNSASRGVLEKMTDVNFRRWTRGTVTVIGLVYLGNGVALLTGLTTK
ncbi:MAG: hypothetical protein JWN73_877 [Betaproteobacteria bacterium]|nr:hypothetical protein [Betaproteobacteria bacterium]